MVKFYSPGCPHCQTLVGPWSKAAEELDGHVQFASVNCRTDNALCQRYRISGVPSLKMFTQSDDGKQRLVLDYEGQRTKQAITDYAISRVPQMVWRITKGDEKKKARDIDLKGFLEKGASLPHAILFKPDLKKPKLPLKTIANRFYRRMVIGMVDSNDPVISQFENIISKGEEALLFYSLPSVKPVRYEGSLAFTPMLQYLEAQLSSSEKDEL